MSPSTERGKQMNYVIYHTETTILLGRSYKSKGAAKAGLTRAERDKKIVDKRKYDIAEVHHFYDEIEKKETKDYINPHSGEKCTVTQGVNTPRSCDPTSDLYWQM